MAHKDISGIKPCDEEGFGNSKSSDLSTESSTYCFFCNSPINISQGSKWSSSSECYASFNTIAHAVQIHIPRPDISYHNKAPLGDNGEYEIDTRHTTTINKCLCRWTTIALAVQIHIPRPHISYHKKVLIGDSGEYTKINSSTETDETICIQGEQCPSNDFPCFPSMIRTRTDYPIRRRSPPPEIHPPTTMQPPDEGNKRPDTNINGWPYIIGPHPPWRPTVIEPVVVGSKRLYSNINWRRIKQVVLVVFICLSVSALVTYFVKNKNVDDPPPPPPPPPPPEYLVSPGDRICVHYDDLHNTSSISHITMQQTSSAYSYNLFQFNMSVNSIASNFTRYVDDWIVDYDISRINQTIRLVQPNAYCSSPGKYSVILEYTDAFHTSFEFEVRMKDPQLHQSITSDDHVHCELTGTCLPSSLAIYVNVNNSAVMVPDTNACSYNDKKTGTMVSIEATIPSSMFTKNQSISCVPLMRNQELAENLTNTIHFVPKCPGPDCKPNCKNGSNTGMYYPNSVYCDKFYQCSNGEAIEKPCNSSTYWEPTKCICDHYNTTICDMNNNTRITPLRTLIPCG